MSQCFRIFCITSLLIHISISHKYKIDYNNQQQTIHINKNGIDQDVNYGDIVDIGNNIRIVYVGNGGWRQKKNQKSNKWPTEIYHFSAEEIDGWPQFVKTGFMVLDNQLNVNEGYTDSAESATNYGTYNYDYFYVKRIMFAFSMVFVCCCFGVIFIGSMVCVKLNMANITKKRMSHFDKLSAAQYQIVSDQNIAVC